ncbi:MAG: hypothetical protein HY775_04185 [Acidobacteria bacterium]|nr:hypothetical protein [Acidobacteriota bacterium]
MITDNERRRILEDVAGGRTTPEQAAALLEDAGEGPQREEPAETARRVRVEGSFHSLKIVGDPEVREAVAEGEHSVVRDGDALVVQAGTSRRFGWTILPRHGFVVYRGKPSLEVRVNPQLPLEVDLDAGNLAVSGVWGPIRAEVDAGSARIEGFRGPIDLRVDAGAVDLKGTLATGESRIRCSAGVVRIHLQRGSSVRIRARGSGGAIKLPGRPDASAVVALGGTSEAVVGDGAGSLDIELSAGAVKVTAD